MIKKEELTGVILAGGQSRRMGCDKAFLKVHDLTFIEAIIKAVAPLVGRVIIIANDQQYEQFGLDVFEDLVKDSGPVAGIFTAMKHSTSPYILVLSCDIPLVHSELLTYLIENSIPTDLNIMTVLGKKQPLTAIYNKNTMPIFADALERKALKLRLLLEQMNGHNIACPNHFIPSLANINTPEELEQIIHENRN